MPTPVFERSGKALPDAALPLGRRARRAASRWPPTSPTLDAVQVTYVNPETGDDVREHPGLLRPDAAPGPDAAAAGAFTGRGVPPDRRRGARGRPTRRASTWSRPTPAASPGYTAITLTNASASAPAFLFIADETPLHRKLGVYEVRPDNQPSHALSSCHDHLPLPPTARCRRARARPQPSGSPSTACSSSAATTTRTRWKWASRWTSRSSGRSTSPRHRRRWRSRARPRPTRARARGGRASVIDVSGIELAMSAQGHGLASRVERNEGVQLALADRLHHVLQRLLGLGAPGLRGPACQRVRRRTPCPRAGRRPRLPAPAGRTSRSSSRPLSTHICGTSAPPSPRSNSSALGGVASSGSSTPANTNSRRCGSGLAARGAQQVVEGLNVHGVSRLQGVIRGAGPSVLQ